MTQTERELPNGSWHSVWAAERLDGARYPLACEAMKAHDAWGAVAELAASQHGVFARSQAANLQLSNKRLDGLERRAVIERLNRDVFRVTAAPMTWQQHLSAANQAGLVVSHQSAAELHGLDGFSTKGSGRIHASSASQPTRKRLNLNRAILVAHHLRELSSAVVMKVNNIDCLNVGATLVTLGSSVPAETLEKALDSALRKGSPPNWIRQTAEELDQVGFRGAGILLKLIADPARSGRLPDSWFERKLSRLVRAAGLPPLVLQQPLGRFRIDGAWPEVKLGLEAHSREFHFGRQAVTEDNRRDLQAAALGWELLYITWDMLAEPDQLAAQLVAAYNARCGLLGQRPIAPTG